jgi:hypothetical protein
VITLLFHAFFATGIAYLLSAIFGSLTPTIAVISLLLGTWMARGRARAILARAPGLQTFDFAEGEAGTIEAILAALVTYLCVRHFAWMFVYVDGKYLTLHPNNFGDLPLHINYIRELARGSVFPPMNPSFASEVLRYPFGPDLYSALWESVGVPISTHLFFVGLVATVTSVITLRWFGGWWAIGGFFFSGGLIGWSAVQGQVLPVDLTQGVDWKNLTLSVFITQRGVLFALPMGLLLIEMTRRHFSRQAPLNKNLMTTLGLCWGILPLFHAHAFVIVSILMAGVAAIESGSVRGLFALLKSRMAILAYIPATVFILRTSDGFGKAKIIHFDPWWTSTFEDAPRFLIFNFGLWLFLPLALAIAIGLSKKLTSVARKKMYLELALYSALFLIFYNVMLAPWAWDNIKILIFPYLGFCHLAWRAIDPILPKAARTVLAILLFASGATAVISSIPTPSLRGLAVYQAADLANAEGALMQVPQWAVFASGTTHEHPLTYLGRLRALGYEGHLWSHGIDYKTKLALLEGLMKGTVNEPLRVARELGVTHIYWGPTERTQYGAEPNWPASFRNVSGVASVKVYEIH